MATEGMEEPSLHLTQLLSHMPTSRLPCSLGHLALLRHGAPTLFKYGRSMTTIASTTSVWMATAI